MYQLEDKLSFIYSDAEKRLWWNRRHVSLRGLLEKFSEGASPFNRTNYTKIVFNSINI